MRYFLIGIVAVALVIWGCVELGRAEDRDQARIDEGYRQWQEFSAQHHCKMKTQGTFAHPNDIWACDGFDVQR